MSSFTKSVAVVTALCFIYTSVISQALYAAVNTSREVKKFESVLNDFIIPYTQGRITDATYYGTKQVVINIQDLHCHPEVQRNISKILSHLDERYKLKVVYVEGGIGEIDTS